MKVLLAEPRGVCAAIETVERAIVRFGAPVYVRHEIVHNRHVVESLHAKGARFVEALDDVPAGATTVSSAHGVSRAVEAESEVRGLPVPDATCPLVSKAHAQARRFVAEGRVLVLIGDAGHPEVVGTMGQVPGGAFLIRSAADVQALPVAAGAAVAYVTQTTLSVEVRPTARTRSGSARSASRPA